MLDPGFIGVQGAVVQAGIVVVLGTGFFGSLGGIHQRKQVVELFIVQ